MGKSGCRFAMQGVLSPDRGESASAPPNDRFNTGGFMFHAQLPQRPGGARVRGSNRRDALHGHWRRPRLSLASVVLSAPLMLGDYALADETTGEIADRKSGGMTLPTVSVTGKREISTATRLEEDPLRVPYSATVVQRKTLDEAGAISLEDSLRSVPGLQHGTQGNYYTRFETRGLRDTQDVLVLIDGVPLRLLQGNADVTLVAPDHPAGRRE